MASNAGGASISAEQLKARYVGTGTYAQFLIDFDVEERINQHSDIKQRDASQSQ
jgi:hypothetical protein